LEEHIEHQLIKIGLPNLHQSITEGENVTLVYLQCNSYK